jgi:transposase
MCLGRKNWLFAGSDLGGERAAAYSLIETAKLNGFDPEGDLRRVLARTADHPVKRVDDLLPWKMSSVRARRDQRDKFFETLPSASTRLMMAG